MAKSRFVSREARLAILDISEILAEVPEKEWGFVLKQAMKAGEIRAVMKALRDLYKKL